MLSIAFALLLQLPQPMPPADQPPPDSPDWPDFLAAPPLCDVERFPGPADISGAKDFNRRHRAWLTEELKYEPDPYRSSILANWEDEAVELDRIWRLLYEARVQVPWRDPWQRRVALKRLRDAIGDEAYSAGRMPPCVPVWRFREMSR